MDAVQVLSVQDLDLGTVFGQKMTRRLFKKSDIANTDPTFFRQ